MSTMKRQPRDQDRSRRNFPTGLRRRSCGFRRFLRHRRRGASAVEFAIVAPLFFLLIFGMFEFGRMIMVQQLMTNAARSGSRVAVIDGATSSGVISTVKDYLEGGSVDADSLTVTVDPSNLASTDTGDAITVQVSVPYDDVSWLPAPWFLSGETLTADCTMRRE